MPVNERGEKYSTAPSAAVRPSSGVSAFTSRSRSRSMSWRCSAIVVSFATACRSAGIR